MHTFESFTQSLTTWLEQADRYEQAQHWPGDRDEVLQTLSDMVLFRAEATNYRDYIGHLLDKVGVDLVKRSRLPAHLTASAAVIRTNDLYMALMHHRKLHRWLQPGGHADGQTNLAQVALEEAIEETGIADLQLIYPAIDCDVHTVPYTGPKSKRMDANAEVVHLDIRFLLLAPPTAALIPNHESNDLRWVNHEQLSQLTNEANLIQLYATAAACTEAWIKQGPLESHTTPSR